VSRIISFCWMLNFYDFCSGPDQHVLHELFQEHPTLNLPEFEYSKAICPFSIGSGGLIVTSKLTPANTLVISRTLIPFKGRFASSATFAKHRRQAALEAI